MLKKIRPLISLVLLLAVLSVAAFYINRHPELVHQLKRTSLAVSVAVLALYGVMFGLLVLILSASIQLCGYRLSWSENSKLNAHSLFINFFVPGQGGPAYRGLYLYKRHHIRVKQYIIVTLLYYAVYAIISVALLLSGDRPWWQVIGALVLVAGFSWGVIKQYSKRAKLDSQALDLRPLPVAYLCAATALQAVVQIAIYSVELHSVNSHIALRQIVIYTGAANLALFVSLTPGAIGIREAFLVFTRHLHHISSGTIIVANVIDRAVYLVFLLILIILTAALHFAEKWRRDQPPISSEREVVPSHD